MSGVFSGHLINGHHPNNPSNSSIVTHGAISFNPMMHGTPYAQQSFSMFGSQSSFGNESISEETAKKIATLQVKLNQKLGPEFISQRPGPGGGPKLTYVEGWKIINLANEVFGFNGWSSSVVNLTTDFADYSEESRRYCVGVTAIMRVTLRDGVFHEDIGYGILENAKSKGAALDKCKKEAVTDGLKRALRNFGNVLGNCLYDKSYASEVIKIKVEPVKLNKDDLHRRPGFGDVKPNISNLSTSSSSLASNPPQPDKSAHTNTTSVTPSRPPMQNQAKSHISLPTHMRSEGQASSSTSMSTPQFVHNMKNQGHGQRHQVQQLTGLNTPITTPSIHQRKNHQVQPQVDRPVSFSEQKTAQVSDAIAHTVEQNLDPDDSFGFGDDDEFLALADLGPPIGADDSDVGRPIGDSDMGRPIDHEEGLLKMPEEEEASDLGIMSVAPTTGQTTPSGSGNTGMSRQELIAAALQSSSSKLGTTSSVQQVHSAHNSATGRNTMTSNPGTSNTKPAPAHTRPNLLGTKPATASSSSAMRPPLMPPQPHPQNQPQNSRTTSMPQQRHQQYMNQKNNNQNQNPNLDPSNTGNADAAKRTSTSSMGGFHYPAGMNLSKTSTTSTPSFSSGIGMKRPVDAISNSSGSSGNNCTSFRAGRPGMGLQQSTTSGINGTGLLNGSGQRQVLGSLEIGEGGDVKRVRR